MSSEDWRSKDPIQPATGLPEMDALLEQMTNNLKRKSLKRKDTGINKVDKEQSTIIEEDESIENFRRWIHDPVEPEKSMRSFGAEDLLGDRSSCGAIIKIQNLFPRDVADGESLYMRHSYFLIDCQLKSNFTILRSAMLAEASKGLVYIQCLQR